MEELRQEIEDKIYEDIQACKKHNLDKIVAVEQSVYSQIDNLKEGQSQLSARRANDTPMQQIELLEKQLEKLENENEAMQERVKGIPSQEAQDALQA